MIIINFEPDTPFSKQRKQKQQREETIDADEFSRGFILENNNVGVCLERGFGTNWSVSHFPVLPFV